MEPKHIRSYVDMVVLGVFGFVADKYEALNILKLL